MRKWMVVAALLAAVGCAGYRHNIRIATPYGVYEDVEEVEFKQPGVAIFTVKTPNGYTEILTSQYQVEHVYERVE